MCGHLVWPMTRRVAADKSHLMKGRFVQIWVDHLFSSCLVGMGTSGGGGGAVQYKWVVVLLLFWHSLPIYIQYSLCITSAHL